MEVGLAKNHHDHTQRHGHDNKRELDSWRFEAEQKGEDQDKDEDRGLAHCVEGQGDCLKTCVAEADVERGCSAAWYETCQVEEWCEERFGRLVNVTISRIRFLDLWSEVGEDDEDGRCEEELDDHVQRGGEERKVEVEVVGGEHPFVVLGTR